MKIQDANWMQVEEYLKRDDRAILPLGSTEQHGYLSLLVDAILPERLALEAAEPLGVPVFPVLPFGVSRRTSSATPARSRCGSRRTCAS